jgi:hypothetical protein
MAPARGCAEPGKFCVVQPFDTRRPCLARAHDYLLGGRNHFAADRELARTLLDVSPLTGELLGENRAFACRAVGLAAGAGVGQFLDIGSGLPGLHEAACAVLPGARMVYIDNDPDVRAQGSALVTAASGVRFLDGDLAEPEALLTSPALRAVLDLREPVCLVLAMVLHLVSESTARGVAGALVRALAPGSYVVISCAASTLGPDGLEPYFGGLELIEPGIADARVWVAPGEPSARDDTVLCGVGRKPR